MIKVGLGDKNREDLAGFPERPPKSQWDKDTLSPLYPLFLLSETLVTILFYIFHLHLGACVFPCMDTRVGHLHTQA